MLSVTILIIIFCFIYLIADKFQEQAKMFLSKLIDLIPEPGNFRILIVIMLLVSLVIIGMGIYFRYDSTNVLP
jgi:hypothetical protein